MAAPIEQLHLFAEQPADDGTGANDSETAPKRRTRLGKSNIRYAPASSILTASTGFIRAYDYTLNPYRGCAFGCSYCYAAFFVRDQADQDSWGEWVEVKENALALLQRKRRKPLLDKTIYMSSVTDPYQPVERELGLTRALLEELAAYHRVRLVVQTRSPLVTRDIDILRQFPAVRINMTITTDDDAIRKVFEPTCASIERRLAAIAEVHQAGLPTCVTLTPLLPVSDPAAFATKLLATGVPKFVVQFFHSERRRFVAGTRDQALALTAERSWDAAAYRRTLAVLSATLPDLVEGRDGFAPI